MDSHMGRIWAPNEPIWIHMSPYGSIWAHMDPYGSIWTHTRASHLSYNGPNELLPMCLSFLDFQYIPFWVSRWGHFHAEFNTAMLFACRVSSCSISAASRSLRMSCATFLRWCVCLRSCLHFRGVLLQHMLCNLSRHSIHRAPFPPTPGDSSMFN